MRTVYFLDEATANYVANEVYDRGYPVSWTKEEPKRMETGMPNENFRTLMNNILMFGRKNDDWKTSPDIYRSR